MAGYRDAECGWIVVEEQNKEEVRSIDEKKRALFLVIYAPKRGILEVDYMIYICGSRDHVDNKNLE